MNKCKRNLRLMSILFLQNICLKYEDCPLSCPLKCGFSGRSFRCFFDCGIDSVAMFFSENVFFDKEKFPPEFLLQLTTLTCNDESECDNCEWHNEYCTLFELLKGLAKI